VSLSSCSNLERHIEPKCKFFAWLINKASTADNLAKKNWPCNPICHLCFCQPETTKHLFSECNYTEALWDAICQRYGLPTYPVMVMQGGPECWMDYLLRSVPLRDRMNKFWGACSFSGGMFGKKETTGCLIIQSYPFKRGLL
jgi:hypothetical protein